MNLKKSIVIVNEFTTKTQGGGTRGGTPGRYVLRYMCRDGAVEGLTPVRLEDTDDFQVRYKRRKDVSDKDSSVREIKKDMRKAQGYGGLAFGNGDASLSHQAVMDLSREIQSGFDNGKTVMKTVISFSDEYLRANGILDEDFTHRTEGDYRGHIDQMKLRMAIMSGLDKMSSGYDDLRYIGVVQVDTDHVHCHLAMYDRGRGRVSKGKQRGLLGYSEKNALRRGIDMELEDTHSVQYMSSNVTHDRRNVKCFVKKFTHRAMEQNGFTQFVMACLPEDRNLWRAGTNRKEMRKANHVVREYVTELLRSPYSGYRDALSRIDEYARVRQAREGFSDTEYRKIYTRGKERLVEDCMNSVYSVLKQVPKDSVEVRTPMLDIMSMDYEDIAAQADSDPMIEFGFKLRSYSSRLQYHRKEKDKYHVAVESYSEQKNADATSLPLYEFFKFEEEYNAMVMCKYQHFLSFIPNKEEYEDEFYSLVEYRNRIVKLHQLRRDPAVRKMTPENAEDYGRRVYDVHGGRFARDNDFILQRRADMMTETYYKREAEFRHKLGDYGLTLENEDGRLRVSREKPYRFQDVKALDIHHMGYDFNYDFEISKVNIDKFVECADTRWALFQGAREYLVNSGQAHAVPSLGEADITLMKDVADRLRVEPVMSVERPDGGRRHKGRTVSLDNNFENDLSLAVRNTLQSIEFI